MQVLLKSSYHNIVYQRRQTIKNIKDLCDNFADNDIYESMFYEYRDIDNLRKAKVPNTRPGAESLIPTIQRYLESYRYNTGFHFRQGL